MKEHDAPRLKAVLRLTETDETNIREWDGSWDARAEQFIPSVRPLRQIVRSMIEYMVELEKPQKQTAKKRKTQKR
jgi:hypothetical protein